MLFLRREGKWDEVSYADTFFTLRNHPERQTECGLGAPQDPMVLALEKGSNGKEGKGKLKRCCSAGSIGQRCTRLGKAGDPGAGDLPEYYQPPVRQEPPQEESGDSESDTPPGSPVSSPSGARQGQETLQAEQDGQTSSIRESLSPD